jgi:hypothetical protein
VVITLEAMAIRTAGSSLNRLNSTMSSSCTSRCGQHANQHRTKEGVGKYPIDGELELVQSVLMKLRHNLKDEPLKRTHARTHAHEQYA